MKVPHNNIKFLLSSLLIFASLLLCPISTMAGQTTGDGKAKPINKEGKSTKRKPVVVTLVNGDRIHGFLEPGLSIKSPINLQLRDDAFVVLPSNVLKSISYQTSRFRYPDHGTSRYFYAPSAISLQPKTGYLSQKELLLSTVVYSPIPNVCFLVGTSIPIAIIALMNSEPQSMLGVGGIRLSFKQNDIVHLGGGVEVIHYQEASIVLPFASMTFGDKNRHLTLSIGSNQMADTALWAANLSGYIRLSDRIALISENWLITDPERYSHLTMLGVGPRFISEKFTTDVGLINTFTEDAYIPIPWLDVTYHFGG